MQLHSADCVVTARWAPEDKQHDSTTARAEPNKCLEFPVATGGSMSHSDSHEFPRSEENPMNVGVAMWSTTKTFKVAVLQTGDTLHAYTARNSWQLTHIKMKF